MQLENYIGPVPAYHAAVRLDLRIRNPELWHFEQEIISIYTG